MSDAKESEWNDLGTKGGKAGMTKGASLTSGLSEHSQITDSAESLGMVGGQGQRPKPLPRSSMSFGGKTFKTK